MACVKRAVDEALQAISTSVDDLDSILSLQAYRLAHWKVGYEEINYRRFFDINDLVALRIELPEVFANRNRQTLELVRSGKVTGLRIDHIDGLWDPECYLRRMNAQGGRPFYMVVEKILGRNEELPRHWPVAGTTGYDFLNAVNGVFIDPAGYERLEEIYSRRTGWYLPFAELCYRSNKLVIQRLFSADAAGLGRGLASLAAQHRQGRDIRMSELTEALIEVTACLPVYRTYIHSFEVEEPDRTYIEKTIELARRRTSTEQVSDAAFEFLHDVLTVNPPYYLENSKGEWLEFVMKWQQFTGPVMAKGLEDTATYRHNSLLSVNEVGGDPLREHPPFDLEEFHDFNRRRLEEWPDTMNATSTHDTKRGEDVRARLNVLSEIPEEWDRRLEQWMAWNEAKKDKVNGGLAPSASEEFLIYQTLLGAWPHRAECETEFCGRVKEFLLKALREAKINSSWISPHEAYERALEAFVDRILTPDSPFLPDFREFQQRIATLGARNSLSQLLLKITSPGAPDFYQGGELWQFTLVDPDNRRGVDYKRRIGMLEDLRRRDADGIRLVRELAGSPLQDEIKLFVTYKSLEFRRANRDLFARGEYIPLRARGRYAENVCVFARRLESRWAVVVAPRWLSRVEDWDDTEVELPEGAPGEWRDALTGLIPANWRVGEILAEFPVGLVAAVNGERGHGDT
jgi:(1->4)-alpha-D-glucan 1-alpha-D-glucosylmutase